MLRTKQKALISGFILSILFSFLNFGCRCENIGNKVLRLHIIANSDSYEDQNLKLKVRDRILRDFGSEFYESKDLISAEKIMKENLNLIEDVARDEILKNGYCYSVKSSMVRMKFNTRTYKDITLPAGYYDALRITIGDAKGKNWWCVMFPPMCLPAAQNEVCVNDILNKDECAVVFGGNDYILGFKFIELFFEVKEFFEKNVQDPINNWLASENVKYEIGFKIFEMY